MNRNDRRRRAGEGGRVKPVSVSLLCNNPDTGSFTGWLGAVDIGTDELMSLECIYDPPECVPLEYHFRRTAGGSGFGCDRSEGWITVAGKTFTILGYKYGFGNWCWDCVIMSPEIAIEFLNHLKSLGCFRSEVAWMEFYETFNAPGELFDERHIPALEESGYAAP